MALAPVVVGVADHNGWAALVCVRVKDGSPGVIDCRRVELIEPGLPKHPYEHETVGMNVAEAERLVQEVRDSAAHCAERALSRLRSGLGTTREIVSIRQDALTKLAESERVLEQNKTSKTLWLPRDAPAFSFHRGDVVYHFGAEGDTAPDRDFSVWTLL